MKGKIVHFKKNGKIGFKIKIPLAVVMAIIITLAPVIMAYGALKEKVDNLKEDNLENKNKMEKLEDRMLLAEKIYSSLGTSIPSIEKNIEKIQFDINEINKKS